MDTVNRRTALKVSALLGASAFASRALMPAAATAEQTPAATGATPSPATHYGPAGTSGDVAKVYQKARQILYPICRVCPQCDGVACAGDFPGIGGLGSGMSFQNNFTALQRVHFKLRPLSGNKNPDCSTTILGQKISFPAMAAPLGGLAVNFPSLHDMSEANTSTPLSVDVLMQAPWGRSATFNRTRMT
jgi:4-hydroxymandelate oxidase